MDPVELVKALGSGADPSHLGLQRTADGYVDLRGLRFPLPKTQAEIPTPVGPVYYTTSKPILRRLSLERIDLTGAVIAHTYCERLRLKDVKMEGADLRGTGFVSGHMEKVSFRGANLQGASFGARSVVGPTVVDVDFSQANLEHAAPSHPVFQKCRFINAKLDSVNFRGSRFEDCVFTGRLFEVQFKGRDKDPNPFIARLRNKMRGVDLSQTQLVFVLFVGIDLSSCKLPAKEHMKIQQPGPVFDRAIENIKREWTGSARDGAIAFLSGTVRFPLRQDVLMYVFRPRESMEAELGPQVAERVIQELTRAGQELGVPLETPFPSMGNS